MFHVKQLIAITTALSIALIGVSLADQDRNRNSDRARPAEAAGRDYPGQGNAKRTRLPDRKPSVKGSQTGPSRDGKVLSSSAVPAD
jgi:hypothetical protein